MEAASGVGACLSENDTTESEINDEYLLDLLHDMGYDVSDEDLSIFKDKLLHFIDEELDICDDTLFSSIVIDSDDDLENFASNILNGQNAECVNSVPSNITNNHHAVPCAITKAYDDLGAETIIKSAHRLLRRLDEHNMVLTNLLKMLEEESPILKESPTNSPNYSAIDYERAVNEHVEISSDTSDRTLTGNGECEVIKVDPSIRKTCIVQRGRLPFKHDPVSRHAFYKKQWSKYPPPGEKKRLSLRWAIRELLLREDTPAVAPNVLARKRFSNPDWIPRQYL